MNLPEKVTPELLKTHLQTAALRHQLVLQICKDLEVDVFDINNNDQDFFLQLHNEVAIVLKAIIERFPDRLAHIIYRIDVNEIAVSRALQNPDGDADHDLAELILHREMRKVFYRNVYNGNIKL